MNQGELGRQEKLSVAIASFLRDKPLFFYLISRIRRIEKADMPCPPGGQPFLAGVGYANSTDLYPSMFYHPNLVDKLTVPEIKIVLEHELSHLCYMHIDRGLVLEDKMLYNIAADCFINEGIKAYKELPATSYLKSSYPLVDKATLASKLEPKNAKALNDLDLYNATSEELYHLLKKDKQLDKTMRGFDTHEMWEVGPGGPKQDGENGEIKSIREAALDSLTKEALADCPHKYPGQLHGQLERMLENLNPKPLLNWKQVLRIFAQSCVTPEKIQSWTRLSRRFPFQTAGKKKDSKPKFLLAIDESGSIGEEQLKIFVEQAMVIRDAYQAELYLVGFDDGLTFQHKLKMGQGYKDIPKHRSGGGTTFQPVFDYAKGKGFDGVVFLTDGYASNQLITYKIPTLFAIYRGKQVQGFRNVVLPESLGDKG